MCGSTRSWRSSACSGNYGSLQLPGNLTVLQNPWVIGVASVLLVIEFVADKVPAIDSGWDVVHTFIRIPAGAVLAAGAFGEYDPAIKVVAALIGGTLAFGSHATKTTTRAAVNTFPRTGLKPRGFDGRGCLCRGLHLRRRLRAHPDPGHRGSRRGCRDLHASANREILAKGIWAKKVEWELKMSRIDDRPGGGVSRSNVIGKVFGLGLLVVCHWRLPEIRGDIAGEWDVAYRHVRRRVTLRCSGPIPWRPCLGCWGWESLGWSSQVPSRCCNRSARTKRVVAAQASWNRAM